MKIPACSERAGISLLCPVVRLSFARGRALAGNPKKHPVLI